MVMDVEHVPISITVHIELSTPFHVGGGKGASGTCDYLLRDSDNQPYWPGSAFKGKVRHFARQLLEAQELECRFEHALLEGENKTPCDCLVCSMLGGAGNAKGSLIFSDMKPEKNHDEISSEIRTGNAIDRYRRTALDNSLFQIEAANNGSNKLVGKITGTLLESSYTTQKELLDSAIKLIVNIGGSTGRGLGWVCENGIDVNWINLSIRKNTYAESSKVTLPIKIKALSPLLIGTKSSQSNFRTTLQYIPGAVIRASLAAMLIAKDGGNENGKVNWVSPSGGNGNFPTLRKAFSDIKITQFLPEDYRFPPLTAVKCKFDCSNHSHDTLSEYIGLKCRDWVHCDERAERVKGFIRKGSGECVKDPLTMVVTRSAINRFTGTSQDEMLFSIEVLTPPIEFTGIISGEFNLDELKCVVEDGLHIGGYQTAGYGKCAVEVGDPISDTNIEECLDSRLKLFGNRIPITLLSDAFVNLSVPDDKSEKGFLAAYQNALFPELSEDVALVKVFAQQTQWRGFDTSKMTGYLKKSMRIIKAGAVFILEASKWTKDIKSMLADLQKNGICRETVTVNGICLKMDAMNGYGQVCVADLYHLKNGEVILTATENEAINNMKPKLIEKVEMVFKNKNEIPKRRQYSGMVQAAAQASCVEELVLLIQYKNAKEGSMLKWTELADPLVETITNLKDLAREVASSLKKENETDINRYHLQLAKMFLGYLMWKGNVLNPN